MADFTAAQEMRSCAGHNDNFQPVLLDRARNQSGTCVTHKGGGGLMGARPPPMFDLVGSSVANVLAGTISNI